MDLDDYQEIAQQTDQFRSRAGMRGLLVPLLGLAGEAGSLLSEFKKRMRDGAAYKLGFEERVAEELGDILWYLTNIASRQGLRLNHVASKNLHKNHERWPVSKDSSVNASLYDKDFPSKEQLPRSLTVRVEQLPSKQVIVTRLPGGKNIGDKLTDNAYADDGYRFHDVFHFAHAAVLGWSPVVRGILGRKRKSMPKVDEVEDGARAQIIEELIVAFVYNNAKEKKYYRNIRHLDSELLRSIKVMVSNLEVRSSPTKMWETAIISGYAAFRHLLKHHRGTFRLDLTRRKLEIIK